MREYTIFASVTQVRAYQVQASDAEEAKDLVRGDYNHLDYDIVDDDIDDVTVEE